LYSASSGAALSSSAAGPVPPSTPPREHSDDASLPSPGSPSHPHVERVPSAVDHADWGQDPAAWARMRGAAVQGHESDNSAGTAAPSGLVPAPGFEGRQEQQQQEEERGRGAGENRRKKSRRAAMSPGNSSAARGASSIPSVVLPELPPLEKLRLACGRLQLSAAPARLPCRDTERADITSFISNGVRSGGAGCALYVSGMPGTGKSATV